MLRTGFVYRKEYTKHETGAGHPECPARLRAIIEAVDCADLGLYSIAVAPAEREDLLRIHSASYIDSLEEVCAEGGDYPDPLMAALVGARETRNMAARSLVVASEVEIVEATWDAALLAAGGGICACKAVVERDVDNAFCAVRPPGHHAESDRPMGFCFFNNIAIAARWLQEVVGVNRIAILDWDVHHGNGTQNAFYDDESVYYASMHQSPHFPMTGNADERGASNTNLNIPMPAGSGPPEWLGALEEEILPEFKRFDPDFLLISAGFDAHRADPLSAQMLESSNFGDMTRMVKPLAEGRIVSFLEGGYHLPSLGESVVEHLRALQADT